MKQILNIPCMFVLMNWAAVLGLYYFLRGRKNVWLEYRLGPERFAPDPVSDEGDRS